MQVENQCKRVIITLVNKLLPIINFNAENIVGQLWVMGENGIKIRGISS